MVRVGEYELRLVRPGGSAPFPEVAGPDGKAYTVAEPGAGEPEGAEQGAGVSAMLVGPVADTGADARFGQPSASPLTFSPALATQPSRCR